MKKIMHRAFGNGQEDLSKLIISSEPIYTISQMYFGLMWQSFRRNTFNIHHHSIYSIWFLCMALVIVYTMDHNKALIGHRASKPATREIVRIFFFLWKDRWCSRMMVKSWEDEEVYLGLIAGLCHSFWYTLFEVRIITHILYSSHKKWWK